MTHPIAMVLALIIVLAIGVDLIAFGSGHMGFLGKKLFQFLEWLAFWR
ncbi:MAG: hypothetical protein VXW58_01965 [Pseudomonadota bacterium]|nr:hypothetical protein [Pseudomonadota bacterium]